jgi:hypothetical protein
VGFVAGPFIQVAAAMGIYVIATFALGGVTRADLAVFAPSRGVDGQGPSVSATGAP